MLRFLKISLAAVALCALAAAPAGAAVKFGSSMLGPPDNETCNPTGGSPLSCTLALSTLPPANQEPGGAVAPSDGVIVAWTLRSGSSLVEHKVRLRVIRGSAAVATGPQETLPLSAGFNHFLARIPVKAGDKIGIDALEVTNVQSVPVIRSLTGADFQLWVPPLADGQALDPTTTGSDYELLLNATLEPDADGDGWGDETQDKCAGKADPTNACSVSAPCPPMIGGLCGPAPTEPVPNTRIGKVTILAAKKNVTFRFTSTVGGSKFQCKLDKKPWKTCKSPKVYSGLKAGRHSFKVRAINAEGARDSTPAKRTFRVAS